MSLCSSVCPAVPAWEEDERERAEQLGSVVVRLGQLEAAAQAGRGGTCGELPLLDSTLQPAGTLLVHRAVVEPGKQNQEGTTL